MTPKPSIAKLAGPGTSTLLDVKLKAINFKKNLQEIDEYIHNEHDIDKKFYYIERIFKAAEVCTRIYFIKYKCSIKWSKDCSINNQNQNNPIPHSLK